MPATTQTIKQYSAVAWGTGGGAQHLQPWTVVADRDVAGISISPDTTYPAAGPFPNIDYISEGLITLPGTPFTVGVNVYLDANGYLTQGLTGQTAIHPTFTARVGHAINASQAVLTFHLPTFRTSSNVRPLVISDADPRIHQATDAEMTALGLTP